MYKVAYIPELVEKLMEYRRRGPGSFKNDLMKGKLSPEMAKTLIDYTEAFVWTIEHTPELRKIIDGSK